MAIIREVRLRVLLSLTGSGGNITKRASDRTSRRVDGERKRQKREKQRDRIIRKPKIRLPVPQGCGIFLTPFYIPSASPRV
jgi:hypothetical protein